jgi:hypothetical protein
MDEYFALATVIEAMELVYLACEFFAQNIKPENEIDNELNKVVKRLIPAEGTSWEWQCSYLKNHIDAFLLDIPRSRYQKITT